MATDASGMRVGGGVGGPLLRGRVHRTCAQRGRAFSCRFGAWLRMAHGARARKIRGRAPLVTRAACVGVAILAIPAPGAA